MYASELILNHFKLEGRICDSVRNQKHVTNFNKIKVIYSN
jgi:hypothetical protein